MSSDIRERLRVFNLLSQNPEWVEILKEALKVEEEKKRFYAEKGYGEFIGWEYFDVHCYPLQPLFKMVGERILDLTLSTRSGKHFRVRNPELIREVLTAIEQPAPVGEVEAEIPADLFTPIVGYLNVKTIITYATKSEKPAHILLSGPPASAKTLFLMELGRLPSSYYALGPTLSAAGIVDLLLTYEPRFLLIDEIDRLSGENLGALNSLMATGIVSVTKFKKTMVKQLDTKVFAAAVRIQKLPSDLLSRFIKLRFPPYTEGEFLQVGTTVLTTMEGLLPEQGESIARAIWQMHQENSDIRQCVQVARLSGGEQLKIAEVLQALRQYGIK